VNLTIRYVSDRHLPDKAIDALDEAGSRVHIKGIHAPNEVTDLESELELIREKKIEVVKKQRYEEAAKLRDDEKSTETRLLDAQAKWDETLRENRQSVTEEHISEVVSMMTGIPVQKVAQKELDKLGTMESDIKSKIIGQDKAVRKVVRAIQRNRAGLKDPNKPIGSFIFLGSTGVGKTQLAKEIAIQLFDSEDALIRMDMSEYMEKFAISRLVGAPPGYVGYEEGGQLTEKVRRKPYSVILLDEVEKAHPDVFNLLLQALDDGHMTDSLGRKVDFRNTLIIMTSNVGSRRLKDFGTGVGFGTKTSNEKKDEISKGVLENALNKAFAPEFLNRIDDVVIFNNLSKDDIDKIVKIEAEILINRMSTIGFEVKITEKAIEFIGSKGYDPKFGARPLTRAIQKFVEDPLAEEIVAGKASEGDLVKFDAKKDADKLTLKISRNKESKTETKEEDLQGK
jgi:ATP-dependent Clp protease ATP-binding subunit ClpC